MSESQKQKKTKCPSKTPEPEVGTSDQSEDLPILEKTKRLEDRRERALEEFDYEGLAERVLANRQLKRIFTEDEVAKHNTRDDCWMIIKGKVYDVTPYVDIHPGGSRSLLKFAGTDGTENVEFHSSKMLQLLDKYFYVGTLEGQQACLIS